MSDLSGPLVGMGAAGPVGGSLAGPMAGAAVGGGAGGAKSERVVVSVDLSGARLGSIQITRKIASGGMGDVWHGIEEDLGIQVAVKVLPAKYAASQAAVSRFMHEARAVAKLDHPNIVRVLQAGRREFQGQTLRVMVMEYVNGGDAHSAMHTSSERRLDADTAAKIVLDAARGLLHAHAHGIVHRDIKPANLLVTDVGRVKVGDFGLSQVGVVEGVIADRVSHTSVGTAMGTPLYMSPEQGSGLEVDGRADVYSLGVTFYELFAGYPPFFGADGATIIEKHKSEEFEYPEEDFASLHNTYLEVIRGMCTKSADERMSLDEVIERLEAKLGVVPVRGAAVPATDATRTNVLSRATSFVGRSVELAELDRLFAGGARLVTVIGPGGVGKTRLAQEYLLGQLSRFGRYPGGVWQCDLTEARTLRGIAATVARGIGVNLGAGDPIQHIHAAIRMRGPMIIMLDNFEQVAELAGDTVGAWLLGTQQTKFLVTSREPLHVEGERLFNLKTLEAGELPRQRALTGTGPIPSVTSVGSRPKSGTGAADTEKTRTGVAPAVKLFAERAAMANRQFVLDQHNREDVERICRELDGLPLAIELAAARTRGLTLGGILERLPKRFELLTSRRRDASSRHTTMLGAVEWSWNLLASYERLGLAQCSVFVDGFLMEAAEAVIDLSAFANAPIIIDVIDTLVEKSLLVAYPDPEIPGETRYRMYESIREYAARQMATEGAVIAPSMSAAHDLPFVPEPLAATSLTGSEAIDALRLRHGRYYASFARDINERNEVKFDPSAIQRLLADLENLLAAQDSLETLEPQVSAAIVGEVFGAMRRRGPWQERTSRIRRALAVCGDDHVLRGKLMNALAQAEWDTGGKDESFSAASEAMEFARKLVERDASPEALKILGRAVSSMGVCHMRVGPQERALELYREAEDLARRSNDRVGLAVVFNRRGQVCANRGEIREAVECYENALKIARDFGDPSLIAPAVGNLGLVSSEVGEFGRALKCLEEAESIERKAKNLVGVSSWTGGRANVLAGMGRTEEAVELLFQAEMAAREAGARNVIPTWLGNRGLCLSRLGRLEEAMECFREAHELCQETGNLRGSSFALYGRAKALYFQIEREVARGAWQRDGIESLEALNQAREAIDQCREIREKLGVAGGIVFFTTLSLSALVYARLGRHPMNGSEEVRAELVRQGVEFANRAFERAQVLNIRRETEDKDHQLAYTWLDEVLA